MDVKTWFFCLSLAIFIYQFTPLNIQLTSGIFYFTYIVANAYTIAFVIFALIENYEKIKGAMVKGQSITTNFVVFKDKNPKKDVVRFLLISLTIALCIDVVLTKLSEQPLLEYVTKYVPGLNEFKDLTSMSISENFNNTITKTQNITNSDVATGLSGFMNVKVGAIKNVTAILIGPTIGPLILFFLRQISYKKRRSQKPENPGARILFIFIIGASVILLIDMYNDAIDGFPSMSYDSSRLDKVNSENNIRVYDLGSIVNYLISFVPNIFFWITSISIWVFDWYLFSRMLSRESIVN